MNLFIKLRWIFGVPLALFLKGLFTHYISYIFWFPPKTNGELVIFYAERISIMAIICSTLPLMTAFFIPQPKKFAVAIAVLINYTATLFGVYLEYQRENLLNTYTFFLILFIGTTLGLALGTYVSYRIFRDKGWDKSTPMEEIQEIF